MYCLPSIGMSRSMDLNEPPPRRPSCDEALARHFFVLRIFESLIVQTMETFTCIAAYPPVTIYTISIHSSSSPGKSCCSNRTQAAGKGSVQFRRLREWQGTCAIYVSKTKQGKALIPKSNLPSTDQADKSKSTSNFQQLQNVQQISLASGGGDERVSCSDEREQHDEAEEQKHEKEVDAQSADQDHEADHCPVDTTLVIQFSWTRRHGQHTL